jgi:peptide deformylase
VQENQTGLFFFFFFPLSFRKQPMKIVLYLHPALRIKTAPLAVIDDSVRAVAEEMLQLMYAGLGVGLAAPQVGLALRLFVLNLTGDPAQGDQEEVIINPEILEREGSTDEEEGCLSLPGVFQRVTRPETIKVRAQNLRGEVLEKTVTGIEARGWQHEVDHLDGILIIDKKS